MNKRLKCLKRHESLTVRASTGMRRTARRGRSSRITWGPQGNGRTTVKYKGHSVVICAKTAEPIEVRFGLRARMAPRNHVLYEGLDPRGKWQFCGIGAPKTDREDAEVTC